MSKTEEITFPVNGDMLHGNVYYPESSQAKNPAVLFITGWTSNRVRYVNLASLLTKLGLICLTFDMRGHGTSSGDINKQTRQDFINDVLAAYDYLVNLKEVDPDDISVVGSSFGSYLGAILTSKRKIRRLAMRVPANYPDKDFDKPQSKHSEAVEVYKWRYEYRGVTDTISLKALHNFEGEILIVESGADEIIPHQTVQNYIDAVKDKDKFTHAVMKGAPHSLNTPELGNNYNQLLYDWFKRQFQL